jgi:4-hydroxybenzoate polyprenyltransferase
MATSSLLLSFSILATTIHAQDFQDCEGDKIAGRLTLPIRFPILSRYSILVGVTGWSFILCRVWPLDPTIKWIFILLGTTVGCRFMALRAAQHDEITYFLYKVSQLPSIYVVLTVFALSGLASRRILPSHM